MLIDKEAHTIHLSEKPNPHVVCIGQSGYGKTYFISRKMENDISNDKKILVIDYSGFFTEKELKKNNFRIANTIISNPNEHMFYFEISVKDDKKFAKDFTDALINIWGITSYIQKTILLQAVQIQLAEYGYINLSKLYTLLKEQYVIEKVKKEEKERVENLSRLLMRMDTYADISNIYFKCGNKKPKVKNKISILQLSDFSKQQKEFLAEMMITLLWKEAIDSKCGRYDEIILDEFQHLSMAKEGALYGLLQEGRKYGVALTIATQFISRYSAEEQDAIMQAGNILFFRPTMRDVGLCAELIDKSKKGEWRNILSKLQIGEAVLNGSFTIEGHLKVHTCPIYCKIISGKEEER